MTTDIHNHINIRARATVYITVWYYVRDSNWKLISGGVSKLKNCVLILL